MLFSFMYPILVKTHWRSSRMAQLLKAKEAADQVYERILKRTEEWKAGHLVSAENVPA